MRSKLRSLLSVAVVLAIAILWQQNAFAATIHIPADQPTIQAGIDAAANGDTVSVSAGTYVENIDFHGKAITVGSASGSKLTIIDGNQLGPVVTFSSGETSGSVLRGFTLRNGRGNSVTAFSGGGIYCRNSSPTITDNVITANLAAVGGGIEVSGGSPAIVGNNITNNIHDPDLSGGWGGGISLESGSSARVVGNSISGHFWTLSSGGGVALNMAGKPLLQNNIIFSNTADGGSPGGGLWIIDTSASVIQNLIVLNDAYFGGGVYIYLSSTKFHSSFVNNTFADNVGNNGGIIPGDGSAAYVVGFGLNVQLVNNILASSSGRESLFCSSAGAPTLTANDGFSSSGVGFGGSCRALAGTNGNISSDPQFSSSAGSKYHLSSSSPGIDAGDNSAPHLPARDIQSNPRVVDGNRDGVAVVDMGSYEFQP